MSVLHDFDIQFLPGIGPRKAEVLKTELGIHTLYDLLHFYPFRYIDRRTFFNISDAKPSPASIQIKGVITHVSTEGTGAKSRIKATLTDHSGSIELVWFGNVSWVKKILKPETVYVVFGRVNEFRSSYSISHPDIEELSAFESKHVAYSLHGIYASTEKIKKAAITNKNFIQILEAAFNKIKDEVLQETLPKTILDEFNLPNYRETLQSIHFPKNTQAINRAQFRIKFEEVFWLQLQMAYSKKSRKALAQGFTFDKANDNVLKEFYTKHLPFNLTQAQIKVMGEIRKDVESGKQMNRLIQGDVGSGKTLVALLAMLMAIDNNYQACMMVPTEILAQQHYQSIVELLGSMDIEVALLTGSTKKKERTRISEGLTDGSIKILIGTHALLEDSVQFYNLALSIVDEQHRFGVAQRAQLWKKNNIHPHVLVMTATPIPRTLAMTLYGDLDISVIDELPPGRKPIQTYILRDSQRLQMHGFLKKQIKEKRQAYIVYPFIKESERLDYKDLEDGYAAISQAFPLPEYVTEVVHGKMKSADKEFAMKQFSEGNADILVATTVIEVGVNVPNATVMVIESAERFGLSQLHQLRGRIGRGSHQSYCILMAGDKLSTTAKTRLQSMAETNDGFELAEIDLKLRGPGDIEGKEQSGLPESLKLTNLAKDNDIITLARNKAFDIIEQDAELSLPEHALLLKHIAKHTKKALTWRDIS